MLILGIPMHGNKGKIFTEEHKKKLSQSHKGQHNSPKTEFKKGFIPWNKNKKGTYSIKHHKQFKKGFTPWNKEKEFLAIRGENNNNWKGGITLLVLQVRHCFKYRQWRSDCFIKDDFTCQICGVRGGHLEIDHYPKMFSIIFKEYNLKTYQEALDCEELWNINNGRVLCKKCHDKTKYGKKI